MPTPASTLPSDTRTITIAAPARQVFDFVTDGRNLPRWAIGFAREVRAAGENRWIVTTGQGTTVDVEIVSDPHAGTVDFHMLPAPGITALACARILPNGVGSEFLFTQFQTPGMEDEIFKAQVEAVRHELVALKALLEVSCPN